MRGENGNHEQPSALETELLGIQPVPPFDGQATPPRGASCGRFLILEGLGVGGMGLVLAAYDPQLDRRVALKLLRPDRRAGGGERARARLLREAQAMARLSHPNVVTVFEAGLVPQSQQVYVAMELIEGETLRAWCLRRQQEPGAGAVPAWRPVVEAYLAAGRGLAAAHAAGLVHRDFKPDNVLVAKDGRVRVTDFGLASVSARAIDPDPAAGETDRPQADPARLRDLLAVDLLRGLSVDGAVMGTPAYMALEQHEGAVVDHRADQFAFCVSLWEALYQERPFRGDSYSQLVTQVRHGQVPDPPRNAGVPPWLRLCLQRGLAPRPADRYPHMEALLRALAHDPRVRRRRVALVGLAGAAAAAIALVVPRGESVQLCSGARRHLTGVWDAGVENSVKRAFLGSEQVDAREVFDRVARRLGDYADRWATMHTEACRATRVRGEQSPQLLDLRMACLERRRGELRALTDALTAADAKVVTKALQATVGLEPLQSCADTQALLAAVPPPSHPEVARRVNAVTPQLYRLRTRIQLGKTDAVVPDARRLLAEAVATKYAPTRALAHWLLAEALFSAHDVGGAEKELLQMARAVAEARDDKGLPRALGRLSTVYELGGQYEKALSMAQAAEVAARRAGDDESLAYAQISAVNSLQALGRQQEAQVLYQEANASIERLKQTVDQSKLIFPLMHLGMATYLRGRYLETYEIFKRMLKIQLETHGLETQLAPELMRYTAVMAAKVGTLAEALDLTSQGRVYPEKRGLQEMPDYALVLIDATAYLRQMGRLEEAERLLAKARPLAEARAKTVVLTNFLQVEADLLMARGKYLEAEKLLRQVRAETLPMDHVGVAMIARLGRALSGQGRRREARAQFAEALAMANKVLPPEHPSTVTVQVLLAGMDVAQGRCATALPVLTAAVTAFEARVGKHSLLLVDPLTLVGRCLQASKRPEQAVAPLERAIALATRTGASPERRGAARAWLARALWEVPDGNRARAAAEAVAAEQELLAGGAAGASDLAELRAFAGRRQHLAARP